MAEVAKNVLVPTDLSEASLVALERVSEMAKKAPLAVTLIHVVDFQTQLPGGALTLSEEARNRVWQEVRDHVGPRLTAFRERELAHIADVKIELIDGHRAAETICNHAREHHTDLIVIATHGRTGVGHLLIGSVAERVIRLAPCDVLVVRTKHDPAPIGE